MDGMVADGLILLGGPLAGDREVLHVVDAPSEEAVRERLETDNWTRNGMLETVAVDHWTILLDGRRV